MNTAVVITAIICGTIICISTISAISGSVQRKRNEKKLREVQKAFDDFLQNLKEESEE